MTYPYRLTVAVPAADMADATALGVCLAAEIQDCWTFTAANWEDGDGNLYAVASGVVGAGVVSIWQNTLVAPLHSPDVDLTAAGRARAKATMTSAPASVVVATPTTIQAYIGPANLSARDVVAAMGLTPVAVEV